MDFKREHIFLIAILIIMVLTGVFIWHKTYNNSIITDVKGYDSSYSSKELDVSDEAQTKKKKTVKKIIIHIDGEVKQPGVYKLEEGSRVVDALKIAGGKTEKADLRNINLAALIYDSQKIIVPDINHLTESPSPQLESSSNKGEKININTATISQLKELTGIGTSKAQNIINYRKKIGNFTDLDQIIEVNGIGEKTLENIKNELTL